MAEQEKMMQEQENLAWRSFPELGNGDKTESTADVTLSKPHSWKGYRQEQQPSGEQRTFKVMGKNVQVAWGNGGGRGKVNRSRAHRAQRAAGESIQ